MSSECKVHWLQEMDKMETERPVYGWYNTSGLFSMYAIEFFLPVSIVIIPDVLVTNLITKLYNHVRCDGMSDHAGWNEVFLYWDTKLLCIGKGLLQEKHQDGLY